MFEPYNIQKIEERNKMIKFRFIVGKSGTEGWMFAKIIVIKISITLISPPPESRKYNNNCIWRETVMADRTHSNSENNLSEV